MGSTGAAYRSSQVTQIDGTKITLSSPLVYGTDKGKADLPQDVKDFEEKRVKNKVEYGKIVLKDGIVQPEIKGNKSSTPMPVTDLRNAQLVTHIHPRTGNEQGTIGGTFSKADMSMFTRYPVNTMRAVAGEGAYSITKSDKLLSDVGLQKDLYNAYSKFHATQDREYNDKISEWTRTVGDVRLKSIAESPTTRAEKIEALQQLNKDFVQVQVNAHNDQLVELHNWLRDNQRAYGYTYALERR